MIAAFPQRGRTVHTLLNSFLPCVTHCQADITLHHPLFYCMQCAPASLKYLPTETSLTVPTISPPQLLSLLSAPGHVPPATLAA